MYCIDMLTSSANTHFVSVLSQICGNEESDSRCVAAVEDVTDVWIAAFLYLLRNINILLGV
jgi:hypothetical protein